MFDAGQELAARAFETLGSLLNSQDEDVKLRAAQAVLRTVSTMDDLAAIAEPSGIAKAVERTERDAVIAALPAGLELPGPAEYPDVIQIDTFRHNSTNSTLKMAG
jgi:hypothetical protein